MHNVNVNKEEGMHSQREEVRTWCKLSFPGAVVSPATDSISALCSVRPSAVSASCVNALWQCERDVRRQWEDVCRQCAGSAQRMRFRKQTQRDRLRT